MENKEFAEYFGLKPNTCITAKIIADDMNSVADILEAAQELGYEAYSPIEYIVQMQEEESRQQGQLLAIGGISLLVSTIGIANTMCATISDRKRDIGIMKVLGMKIRRIRDLFLLESALIGMLGGFIGILVSYITVLIINTRMTEGSFLGMYFHGDMRISIPPWLSGIALLIAIGVGMLAGIYPAYTATKLSPLEAMRN